MKVEQFGRQQKRLKQYCPYRRRCTGQRALLQVLTLAEPDIYREIGISASPDVHRVVSGYKRIADCFSASSDIRGPEPFKMGVLRLVADILVAVHEDAAGEADHKDVEPDTDPTPQMDLEQSAAQPHLLRLTDQALKQRSRQTSYNGAEYSTANSVPKDS